MKKLTELLKANNISFNLLPSNQVQVSRNDVNFDLISSLQKIGLNICLLDSTAIIYN